MDCFLLGSGGMMPMPFRFLTSLVVRVSGTNYLFDAGEGTQISYKIAKPGLRALKLMAITHLHADHCLGIPGLLMLRSQMEAPEPLTIVGPPGIRAGRRTTAGRRRPSRICRGARRRQGSAILTRSPFPAAAGRRSSPRPGPGAGVGRTRVSVSVSASVPAPAPPPRPPRPGG